MFEALVTLCLTAADPGGACRDVLIPGFAAEARADCERRLAMMPPGWLSAWPDWKPACAPLGPPALDFAEIAAGVFVHAGAIAEPDPANRGNVSNAAFIVGRTGVAVIDAGGSRAVGEDIYRAVRVRTGLPVTHLILTHVHPDHVYGMAVFRDAGARIVGHAGFDRALADRQETYAARFAELMGGAAFLGSRIAAIDREVADSDRIDLGGRVLELRAWPLSHSGTDLTVFDPASGTLFAGDLVVARYTPALDGSLRGWQAVLKDLRAIPARQVVPGHGGPVLPWPRGAGPVDFYLGVLAADTRAAIDRGLTMGDAVKVIGRSEAGKWQLFDLFNPRNATVAYSELEWE